MRYILLLEFVLGIVDGLSTNISLISSEFKLFFRCSELVIFPESWGPVYIICLGFSLYLAIEKHPGVNLPEK